MPTTRSLIGLSVLLAGICLGQSVPTSINLATQGHNVDFSSFPFTRPEAVGATLPATCSTGQLFFESSAAPGLNLYACTSNNVWTMIGASSQNTSLLTIPFSGLTSGSNTQGALTVGSGASLSTAGTGIINANQINGAAIPTSQACLGTTSTGQLTAGTCGTGSGSGTVSSTSTQSGQIPVYSASTVVGPDSQLDDSVTAANVLTYNGAGGLSSQSWQSLNTGTGCVWLGGTTSGIVALCAENSGGSVIDAGNGTVGNRTVDVAAAHVITGNVTPASSSAACTANQLWADDNYIYHCTSTGGIRRAPLASF